MDEIVYSIGKIVFKIFEAVGGEATFHDLFGKFKYTGGLDTVQLMQRYAEADRDMYTKAGWTGIIISIFFISALMPKKSKS